MSDFGVAALARGCSKLSVLNLSGCVQVTGASLRALSAHCPQLQVLLLEGCRGLNDAAVSEAAPRLLSRLRLLDATGCAVTPALLTCILQVALGGDQGGGKTEGECSSFKASKRRKRSESSVVPSEVREVDDCEVPCVSRLLQSAARVVVKDADDADLLPPSCRVRLKRMIVSPGVLRDASLMKKVEEVLPSLAILRGYMDIPWDGFHMEKDLSDI